MFSSLEIDEISNANRPAETPIVVVGVDHERVPITPLNRIEWLTDAEASLCDVEQTRERVRCRCTLTVARYITFVVAEGMLTPTSMPQGWRNVAEQQQWRFDTLVVYT